MSFTLPKGGGKKCKNIYTFKKGTDGLPGPTLKTVLDPGAI